MAALSVQVPYPVFYDRDGVPLDNGNIYIGVANLDPVTNPLQVYYDEALTITASQPLITSNGYVYRNGTPAQLYVNAVNFSILANDSKNLLVYNFPDGTGLGVGAASIEYDPPFTGAVTSGYTVADKLSQSVSVIDFGAVPDGITDNTTAFNAAILASKAVYAPSGVYIVDVINLAADTFLFGDGASSILKQKSTFIGGSTGSLYANSGSATDTLDNITIRDLRIEGTNISSPVFSQYKHLISLNGTRNVLIENVQFVGFQGDGLYFGSGIVAGDERHNYNITVSNCFFDGINQENRQGISVSDGVDGIITGCTFQNCTKSTMPGAIDFEPNNYAFETVNNWLVTGCTFKNVGGNFGQIGMLFPTLTTLPTSMIFCNNNFSDYVGSGADIAIDARRTLFTSDSSMQVLIDGNHGINGNRPIDLLSCKGVRVTGSNAFENYLSYTRIGSSGATEVAVDVYHAPTYRKIATAQNQGVLIGKVDTVTLGGSMIECCQNSATAYPFQFAGQTSTKVTFEGVRLKKLSSQIIAINNAGATLTASGNRFINNELDGLISQFESVTSQTVAATKLESWTGTANVEINGTVGVLKLDLNGGTQAANTLFLTLPNNALPLAQTYAIFGSGTGVVLIRLDTDGNVFITPNAAPGTFIAGSVSFMLAI